MSVKEVTDIEEFRKIINGDRPAAFDFWATWCGPCKQISPIFEKLAESNAALDFYKVDVDAAEAIAQEIGVRAMPTFIIFSKGKKIAELVGANPQKLNEIITTVAIPQ